MPLLRSLAALAAAGTLAHAPAFAADPHSNGHGGHTMQMAATPATGAPAAPAEGTVKKVDKTAGKITISHGPLENLGMPAMTMAFRVADAAMLDQVQAGDKIRFVAERVHGVFTVTKLEAAK